MSLSVRVNHRFHLDGPGLYAGSLVPQILCPDCPPAQEKWAPDEAPRLADAKLPRLFLLLDVVLGLDIKGQRTNKSRHNTYLHIKCTKNPLSLVLVKNQTHPV